MPERTRGKCGLKVSKAVIDELQPSRTRTRSYQWVFSASRFDRDLDEITPLIIDVVAHNLDTLDYMPPVDVYRTAAFAITVLATGVADMSPFDIVEGADPAAFPDLTIFHETIISHLEDRGVQLADQPTLIVYLQRLFCQSDGTEAFFNESYKHSKIPFDVRQDESADLNTHAGVLSSPSYEDIKDALELMEKDLMSAAAMAAGAALMIGMSLISGLGTDELLRLQEARGRGGRRRLRRLRPGEVTGGRDTATTVEDGSRLSLQLSVSSTGARSITAACAPMRPNSLGPEQSSSLRK